MPGTLFVSDLHLDPERPAVTASFLGFLATRAREADAVYILGDLFEAWIGDDDETPLNLEVIQGIRACVAAGTPVFVMHGNRDFLLGDRFATLSRCILLPDPARIDLYGIPTLLMHGDLLCTDDTEYLAFRDRVRDSGWQSELLAKPLAVRREMAAEMRRNSREKTAGKPESIMDVNPTAVRDTMMQHAVLQLIHGHTHRPGVHTLQIAGQPARRYVLGDWYDQGSMLECDRDGCRLQELGLQR
ncbi:MAG: UDP-2,3-diacylglucosamine diphosphatase [Gammaproteobacteria bacterium]|jgi:UDP-2,3-diacylglucosamine hydrolase